MNGTRHLACLWTLFIILTGCAFSDIQFLERGAGQSVLLPCAVDQRGPAPYGLYLKRSWLRPGEVLFMYTESEFTVSVDEDRNRTSVRGDPSRRSLNVTISQLRASDTDRYYCEFMVGNSSPVDERLRGKSEFFLLVSERGQCGCSSYSTLLYALSSAVAVLLLLLTSAMIYRGKACCSGPSRPQAPIYEEMAGVQPLAPKLAPRHLEETESSEYRNCPVKKSCPRNHYESPRRGARVSETK